MAKGPSKSKGNGGGENAAPKPAAAKFPRKDKEGNTILSERKKGDVVIQRYRAGRGQLTFTRMAPKRTK